MTLAQIPADSWWPPDSAFQVYPSHRPLVARHVFPIDLPTHEHVVRICEEVEAVYDFQPIGNDGRFAYFA